MSDNSKIEWCTATWNVITGCTKVSDGCDHCYIERTPPFRMAGRRFDRPGVGGTTGVAVHLERLAQPLKWRNPRRVFTNSLSDIFHADVPDEVIARMWAIMALTPQHRYQVLTKRPARMRSLLTSPRWTALLDEALCWTVDNVPARLPAERVDTARAWATAPEFADDQVAPLSHVWLGVTAENQWWADLRIPALLETPAAVRFLSCEPLIGAVDLLPYLFHQCDCPGPDHSRQSEYGPRPDWIICGGESGPGARPMHPDWARRLRDACQAAGVAYFFKQWGEWAPIVGPPVDEHGQGEEIVRVGKKAAGRLLDGREWSEFPEAVTR